MLIWKITLILILSLLILVIAVTIWRAIFSNNVRKLKGKIEEYLVVIDIAAAVKKDFLSRLVKLINLKEKDFPKSIKDDPLPFWTNLERGLYIKSLKQWEEKIITLVNTKKDINQDKAKDLLNKIADTDERIKTYLFTYNNNVLKYNYKLTSKQGKFFLNKKKFPKKELLNLNNNIALQK